MNKSTLIIPEEFSGQRLDRVLPELLPQFSRTFLQQALKEKKILLNQTSVPGKIKINGGEELSFDFSSPNKTLNDSFIPQSINLPIAYEDEDLIIINKPVGLVVHPGAGNWEGTLLNGLLHHYPQLAELPRAGIVHRLDKDTSGLMIVAKTRIAYHHLVQQLQEHMIDREYYALVYGNVTAGNTIKTNIGRDPRDRLKMAILPEGKSAVTHYRLVEKLGAFTLLRVKLETGRTHQIRLHLSSVNYPIVGDPLYGKGLRLPKNASIELINALKNFRHQALHAWRLNFLHPNTNSNFSITAELPDDYEKLLSIIRCDHELD